MVKRKSDTLVSPVVEKQSRNDDNGVDSTILDEKGNITVKQVGKKGLAGPKCWKDQQMKKDEEPDQSVPRSAIGPKPYRRYDSCRRYRPLNLPARTIARMPARLTARTPARLTARTPARSTDSPPARLTDRSPACSPARSPARSPTRSPVRPPARSFTRSPTRSPDHSTVGSQKEETKTRTVKTKAEKKEASVKRPIDKSEDENDNKDAKRKKKSNKIVARASPIRTRSHKK